MVSNEEKIMQPMAKHVLERLEYWFIHKSTADWPDDVVIDTSEMGPRATEQQEVGLRLSYGIACDRLQWYKHNEPKSCKPAPAIIQLSKFSVGDLWEAYTHGIMPHCVPKGWKYINAKDLEVELYKIKGHLDGLIVNKAEKLIVVADSKAQSPSRLKNAINNGPDMAWGNWHQAANYAKALVKLPQYKGFKVVGFIWPTILPKQWGWEPHVGWANRAELTPWGEKARKAFRQAKELDYPPVRWEHTNVCKYCNAREHCKSDPR